MPMPILWSSSLAGWVVFVDMYRLAKMYLTCTCTCTCSTQIKSTQSCKYSSTNYMWGLYIDQELNCMVHVFPFRFHGTYKCPFGSTSVRTAPLVKRDEIMYPGPAHYQQRPPSAKGGATTSDRERMGGVQVSGERPSYTFASTTSRLYSPPNIVTVSVLTLYQPMMYMYMKIHIHVCITTSVTVSVFSNPLPTNDVHIIMH